MMFANGFKLLILCTLYIYIFWAVGSAPHVWLSYLI